MTPDQLDAELRAFAREVADFAHNRAGRTPRDFAQWYWTRAEAIKANAGAALSVLAGERLVDITDGAVDAGLFGTDDCEDTPFPE